MIFLQKATREIYSDERKWHSYFVKGNVAPFLDLRVGYTPLVDATGYCLSLLLWVAVLAWQNVWGLMLALAMKFRILLFIFMIIITVYLLVLYLLKLLLISKIYPFLSSKKLTASTHTS